MIFDPLPDADNAAVGSEITCLLRRVHIGMRLLLLLVRRAIILSLSRNLILTTVGS